MQPIEFKWPLNWPHHFHLFHFVQSPLLQHTERNVVWINKTWQFIVLISTTNIDACVCVFAKLDQFLPVRSHLDSNQRVNSVRIAIFQSANFGPFLFAFYCPLFFLRKQNKEWIYFATLCDVLKISSPGNRYMALPPPTKTVTAHFGQDPFRPYAAHN